MGEEIKRLNLGCGYDCKPNWINTDFVENKGVDIVWDLNKFPYPFKDNEFQMVLLNHVLEHLENPEKVIQEIWRITSKNAKTIIRVPHFSCWQAWGDITHKRTFNHTSLMPFSYKQQQKNTKHSLLDKKIESFHVYPKIKFGKIKKLFAFELVWNIHNIFRRFYEANLAYILPADQIEFILFTRK